MSADLHRRASELFVRLRGLPADQRQAALRESCDGDEELRNEVESLLAHDGDDRFLDRKSGTGAAIRTALNDALTPTRVGSFEIIERIGEGGMGVVYRARQQRPQREVALKMMRGVLPSDRARRRFEREADLLGRLQHPGVAQIYEAGAADGQPYFAMELIAGQSITAYADQRELSANERLTLLASVCDAVQHAHQRGVIHRDLKPANILIDGTGNPKVLDFGVARALDADYLTRAATQTGQLLGTPRYMAPEQFLGEPDRVDARCDVYALGVIGFELLAGRPPLDFEGLSLAVAFERARHEEPPRLGSLLPELRGDVETIIATALAKDPERRYASVGQFAEDLRRYLRDEPIFARPTTLIYQLRKFARRRRGLVTAVGIVFVAVLAGGVASTWALIQSMRANAALLAEQERTVAEAEKSRLAFDFMRRTLTSVDPDRDGKDVRLIDALDAAAGEIAATFAGRPDAEAHVRQTFGTIYHALGQYPAAREQLDRALALLDQTSVSRLIALSGLAEVQQDAADGGALADTAQQLLALAGDTNSDYHARALGFLGKASFLLGDDAAAERWTREAIAAGAGDPESLAAHYHNLGQILERIGKLDEACEHFEHGIELLEQHRGPENDDTLRARSSYADLLALRGQYDRAEPMLRAVLEARQRRFGPDHPRTLTAMRKLGRLQSFWMGRFDEGDGLLRDALARAERSLGSDDTITVNARGDLASSYFKQQRYADAESLYRDQLGHERKALGERHPQTLRTANNLGQTLQRLGRAAEADTLYGEWLPIADAVLSGDQWEPAIFRIGWGNALIDLGRLDEAEPLLRQAESVLVNRFGTDHYYSRRAAESLERLKRARGGREGP